MDEGVGRVVAGENPVTLTFIECDVLYEQSI